MIERSDSTRGKILSILVDRDEMTRSELAEHLAADPSVHSSDVDHLEIVLHHKHLPKLEQNSYLEYDYRTGIVVQLQDPREIRSQLEKQGHE